MILMSTTFLDIQENWQHYSVYETESNTFSRIADYQYQGLQHDKYCPRHQPAVHYTGKLRICTNQYQ